MSLFLSIVAFLHAQAALPPDLKAWEDVSAKLLLLFGLIFMVRLYLQREAEHRAEIKETWEQHKKDVQDFAIQMEKAIAENTQGLAVLTGLTKEQTDYYKAVTRNILDEKLKGLKPSLP